MQGLVDVAHPVAEELQRSQLLLVGRVWGCQDREVMLDRADHALFGERALIIIEAGRAAREIDKVLGCTLPRPSATGPTPNPPAGNALVALAPLLGRQAAQEHIERLGTVPTTSLKLMSVQGAAEYAHVKHSDGAPHD